MKNKSLFGFPLWEVVIAVLIFITWMAALTTYHVFLQRNASLEKQRIEALNLAQAKLEYFRSYQSIGIKGHTYDDIVAGSDPAITGTNGTFTRSWVVTTATNPSYKTVDMSVTWNDRRDTAQKVELVTIISRTNSSWTGSVRPNKSKTSL